MTFSTPDTPHKGILPNTQKYTKISYDIQKRYRSGVGFLIYLAKHSRPELFDAVRELSKCMDEASMITNKALLHTIKYAIDTKDYCCQMRPDGNINEPRELSGYSDADHAGDKWHLEKHDRTLCFT